MKIGTLVMMIVLLSLMGCSMNDDSDTPKPVAKLMDVQL